MALDLSERPTLQTAFRVLYTLAALNVAASVLTIALIIYMRNRKVLRITMYLEMVIAMTIFQALYDMSFFFSTIVCDSPGICFTFDVLYFSLMGITTSLWALLIICSVGWVISYETVPSATFIRVCWGIVVTVFIGVAVMIEEYMRAGNVRAAINVYSVSRITIIAISVVQVVALYVSIYSRSGVRAQQDPLYHLVRKLVWYPLVQIISRMGGSTYDLVYHRLPSSYTEGSSFQETVLLYMFVIFTPSAGIGCAAVFCTIQKGAWICLKRMLFPWVDYGALPAYLLQQYSGRQSSARQSSIRQSSARQSMTMNTMAAIDEEEEKEEGDEDRVERLALLDEEELAFEVAHGSDWEKGRGKKFTGGGSGGGSGGGGEGEGEREVDSDHTFSPMSGITPVPTAIVHPL